MKKKKLALGGFLSGGLSGASTGLQIGSMFGPAGSIVGATLGLIGGGILGSKQEDIAKNQAKQELLLRQLPIEPKQGYQREFAYGGDLSLRRNINTNKGTDRIPVDVNGNPTLKNNIALTDDGEVIWNKYVFSKKLGYADKAMNIASKYKIYLGENFDKFSPIHIKDLNRELENLRLEQEMNKPKTKLSKLPKLQKGASLSEIEYLTRDIKKEDIAKNQAKQELQKGASLSEIEYLTRDIKKDLLPGAIGQGTSLLAQGINLLTNKPKTVLPQNITPRYLDYTENLQNIYSEGNKAINTVIAASRNNPIDIGTAVSRIYSEIGKQASDYRTKIAAANMDLYNRAQEFNAKSAAETNELNAREQAGYEKAKQNLYQGIGNFTSGLSKDLISSKWSAIGLLNMGDRYKFDPETGKIINTAKTTSTTSTTENPTSYFNFSKAPLLGYKPPFNKYFGYKYPYNLYKTNINYGI